MGYIDFHFIKPFLAGRQVMVRSTSETYRPLYDKSVVSDQLYSLFSNSTLAGLTAGLVAGLR